MENAETGLALATEDASGDEHKYTFSFSGGVLDVRYHDVETVFAQHPIVSNIEIHDYRRVKAHSLIKMLRVVNGEAPAPKRRPRGGAVAQPAVRKIPMRLIIPELNEILGQWVRKSKEQGKAIELAEFVQKFASDQYGVKTMADDHLVNLVASIQALEGQSDRIAFFGMALGLTKPEMYTPLLSEVLFAVISLLFESSRDWCECLDTGDGASWVPQERVEVMAEKLFDAKSHAWLLEVAHADCTRLKTPMPWNASARSSFDNHLASLAVEPSAMGISRAKARHVTVVSGLDAVLKFVLSAWLMEWARTLSHLERVEAEFRAAEQREIQIRADIRSSASERPFTVHEKEILWDLAGEVLAEGRHKTMPRNAAHKDWQTLQSRNSQRREKELHFLRNRRPEDLCVAYQEILKEHHHKEALRWDFNRWDWDEDWEWGGLTLACDGPEQPQSPESLGRQETQRQHLSPTLQASATMPSLRDHGAGKSMHLKHSHSSSTSAFNFGYFAVGSRHARTVTEALWKHQQPVASLCLRDNQFNDEACTMIVAAIAKQHQVATFDLSCNLAGSMTATMLAKQAEVALATHLTTLHLANNRFDNAAMADLLKVLACHRALRELNIAGNGLGSSSILARALATLVCTNRKGAANITTLDLSWNKLLSSDVVPLLKELAANNRCLCVLKLDLNLVDEGAMEALAACMKSNSFLQSVSLAHNKLRMPLGTEAMDARVHIISSGEVNQDADIVHL
ncbi:Tonsoku-like protein [Hondaea fermentalgiana]|uniref:Tonsoku-like protein n=1 Tax=Hondaea fermentalgiana TaxID=2315210 RepID=A0A2R5G4X5_9STRA|nr:Tonsoku-like protein [Hondaea fermentalgiana]|eukprot:GBG25389.1 Tonsoku-like protein [Hondaea fermentalgiana]